MKNINILNNNSNFNLIFNNWEKENAVVVLDTSIAMDDYFRYVFYRELEKYNSQPGNKLKITVFDTVQNELGKNAISKSIPSNRGDNANTVINYINRDLKKGKNFKIYRKTENKDFADAEIIAYSVNARIHHKPIYILTQDRKLTDDLVSINNLKSVKGSPVNVVRHHSIFNDTTPIMKSYVNNYEMTAEPAL